MFYNYTTSTEFSTLSLHDALPISVFFRKSQIDGLTERFVARRGRLGMTEALKQWRVKSGPCSSLVAGCGPLGVIAVARADGNLSAPPWGNGLHLYAAEPAIAVGVGRVIRQGVLIADVMGDLSTDGFGVLCSLGNEGQSAGRLGWCVGGSPRG